MFVSAWFCVRLTGTVGEMGRYLDSMDSVVCMEELLDYEKEENGRTMEENDLAEPTLQVRMLEREDSAAAVSDSTQLSISSADYQVLLKIVEAEAGSEDLNGRILVANVVLNRVKSELFPDCVTDVVYQHSNGVYQFSPVKNGTIDTVSISEETKQAVELALDGTDLSKGRCTLLRGMRRMKKICAGSIHIWSDCLRMADMSSLDKDKKSEKVLSCQKTCDKIERNGQKKETKLCNCSRNRRKHGSFV